MLMSELENYVEKIPDSGCWIWMRGLSSTGYGAVKGEKNMVGAHRVFYEKKFGLVPAGLFVLHRCDVRCCVNPDHLFVGTQKDNVHDAMKKNRLLPGDHRGEHNGRAKFTEEQVLKIRADPRGSVVVAAELGVHRNRIYEIRKRQTWRHL